MNGKNRILLFLILAGIALGLGRPALVQATLPAAGNSRAHEAQTAPQDKIEASLLNQVEAAGQADFFVWMAEKADLSPAADLPDKEAKGAFVFKALRTTAEASQKELRAFLDSQNMPYRAFYIANKILVRGGGESLLLDLAGRSDVARITANHTYQLEEPVINPKGSDSPDAVEGNIAFVNADGAWALGFTGQGTVVGAIDTGLDWQHPAILDHYRGWNGVTANHNYNWWDPTGTYPNAPGDGFGHGTHVTGTMVGDDGGTNQIGMAPGAQTVACKGLDDFGGGDEFTLTTCFEFFLAPWDLTGANPDPSMAPDAINNSWGYWGGGFPAFQDEIDALQAAGVLVEVSAGNEGPSCQTLGSPGDYGEVTTTGSVSWASGSLPGSLTWFSSRGPSSLSPDYIPDVMAPGENVRSSVPGGGYQAWDGTSMAGPHVTGLVGLLWAANPGLRGLIPETNLIIQLTSVPLSGQTGSNCGGDYDLGPNNDWGYGTIDALAAVQAALQFGGPGTLAGTVTDSATSDPLENVLIKAALTPDLVWQTSTDASGQYTRVVFSGTYTVSAGLYGYYSAENSGITVQEGLTTTLDIQLDPAPSYLVSGTVADALTGWPLYARVDILGYPYGPVWTDPLTGEYGVSLAAGQTYTIKVTPFVPGYLPALRIVAPLTGPQSEDFALNADLLACQAPGYVPDFVYFEDFEAADGGFSAGGGLTSWEWGAPTSGPRSAHSGSNAWATNLAGDYFDNEFGMITSPDIDMSAYSGQTILLSWWQWLKTEQFFDYAWVEVSNDGGSSWSAVYGPIDGPVSTSWTKQAIPLDPSYAVSNFRVRFVLQSDFSITYDGFYVDDVGVGVAVLPPNLYAEDFESNDDAFIVSGTTSWAWGTPTRGPSGAHSGLNAWATNLNDNYGANEDGWITSPVIDLSAGAGQSMLLSWWQWLQTESGYDFASVEITDDGLNWTPVLYASGVVTTDWVQWYVELDPAFATSTFQVRFGLQSDGSVSYPGFYVDDLSVDIFSSDPPAVPCDPQSGGLLVGYVLDENNALPLNGATVAGSEMTALSMPTPADPAVEDGFYTLFALAGTQPVTATLSGYGQDVQNPTVVLDGVVWQDFSLAAGLLAPNPDALAVTLDMGDTTSAFFDLDNQGNRDASFELREKGGDFTPALALAPVQIPAYEPTDSGEGGNSYLQSGGSAPAARGPMSYQVPAGARLSGVSADVLLLAAADVTGIRSIMQAYPDLAVVDVYDARIGVPTLADLLPYDAVVVISNNPFADPAATGDALADYIDAGGKVVQTVPTFNDPFSNGWGLQGRFISEGYSPFIGTGDAFTWADLGSFDAAHPIMDGVTYAGDYFRQLVDLAPGAEWIASWTDDEFIATTDSVVALNTFLPDGWAWDGDIPLILHNSIIWLQTAGDVLWLSTDPITGTVSAQSTVSITVNFDASVPEITQPGDYTAAVRIVDDTPYDAPALQVTMTVNPPDGWGKLDGSVEGLGYCDSAGNPLEGADVDIQGVTTTQTGIGGLYGYWMAAGSYTLTVSAPGYVPQSMQVSVLDGQTTTQDVSLRLDAPCLEVDPGAINLILDPGGSATESLNLDNAGAGALNYTLLESTYPLDSAAAVTAPDRPAGAIFTPAATGPASVVPLKGQSDPYGGPSELPLSGWFGALDHPEGLIRYAYAQCYEQPDSYYVFSGVDSTFSISTSAWRYDAASNNWTQLADLPAGGEAPVATCYQGKIFVMGGGGGSDLFIYSIAGDSWSFGATLPRGVEGAAAAAWNGMVFLAGGDDDFSPWSGVSDEVNIYDIASDSWVGNGASLPVATGNAGFAQIGPFLYVVGGWGLTAPDFNSNATQRYDLENDSWELGPEFSSARADFALAATDGALYALGGDKDGNFFFEAVNATERLDLSVWPGGSWEDMSDPLPVALQANQAGACTQALFDPAAPEIWSIGGLDTNWFLISGRTLFQERAGESCFSIYTDVDWLSVDAPAGSVPGDSLASLQVFVDASNLAFGMHTANLVLVSNDPGAGQIVVPVTVMVGQPYQLYLPFMSK